MVVSDVGIHNIMGGMENTAGVRLHNHRRKLKQRFDIIRKLGQGTYGKVQLGINKETGQEVAIKTIKKAKIETEADLVRIRREIQIMSSVQHPNIIHIYEVFENREKMVLVMEHAAGGELYDYLSERKVLSEQEARRIFRQIATAVYYCHKHKICHRDLKLENILLDEHGSAKIADFGLSNVFDEQRLLNTFCGSPLYASPEIVKGTPYHGPEVDCWSLGVLLYTLVYGAMPFDGSNFKRLVKQISQGDYFEPKKPSPASPLIRDMLTVPPARRADIEKICSHWWVNEDYTESCLEIAEELANQTPVRLDLLLSLAPPAPSVGSDKLLITKEQAASDGTTMGTSMIPARCHSVGSLMELDHPSSERRVTGFDKGRLLQGEASNAESPKRKLEEGISTEEANQASFKKKERSRRRERDRSSDRRHHRSNSRNKHSGEGVDKTQSESKEEGMKSERNEEMMDVDTEGNPLLLQYIDTSLRESEETITGSLKAATSSVETIAGSSSAVPEQEHVEVVLKSPTKEKGTRKSLKKKGKAGDEGEITDKPSAESSGEKENLNPSQGEEELTAKVRKTKQIVPETEVPGDKDTQTDTSLKVSDKIMGGGDHSCQNLKDSKESNEPGPKENTELKGASNSPESNVDLQEKTEISKKGVKTKKSKGELTLGKLGSSSEKSSGTNTPEETGSLPSRPMERRRSKIFETAEKFNTLLSGSSEPKSPTTEKPKKVFIPGVKVSDAKRAFERKSSLPEAIVPTLSKTSVPRKASEANLESTLKGATEDTHEGPISQKTEKKTQESSSLDGKDREQNGTKANSAKTQQSLIPEKVNEKMHPETSEAELKPDEEDSNLQFIPALPVTDKIAQQEEARIKKLKDAVEIISNAIAEESKKDSLPDSIKKVSSSKPPVPASPDTKGRSKGVGVASPTSPKSPPPSSLDPMTGKKTVRVQVAPNEVRLATVQVSTPKVTKFPFNEQDINKVQNVQSTEEINGPSEDVRSEKVSNKDSKGAEEGTAKKKSAKVEITLKSATLPRRKTSKAEIQLGSPVVPPVEFKTEVEHMVGAALPTKKPTQRSEVAFPIAGVASKPAAFRSVSVERDEVHGAKPRERIIPIKLEDSSSEPLLVSTPPARPPVPPLQQQRSLSQSQRSGSLSRQSTQDSDTEGPDSLHKSPREFIIPIAMEGGGYVTPRAGSLEPSASDESTSKSRQRSTSRFGRLRRMSSLLSDASEDEGFNSTFGTLRHSSLGRDDDDDKSFHMHRLRSSRPSRHPLEHADSLSSAEEEDDDDDGFELLTAESLFSTLLSRVRSLTQRLNVEDAGRPGFPSSRLMNQLKTIGHTSPSSFWNNVYAHQQEPLSRRLSESSQFSRSFSRDSELGSTPWRRSASRDVSDCDSVYSETSSTAGTLPRGSTRQEDGGMCDEAASETSSTTSSYPSHYTPSLARRISKHYKHRAADEELGGQTHANINSLQSYNDHLSRRDYLPAMGNSLSYLHSHDSPHYIPSSSRRLARTSSVRSANEERTWSGSRRREFVPSRRLSFLEARDIRGNCDLYNKSSFHGSSHSDLYDYKKRDYLPPTHRTLRLLDSNTSSGISHRDSSASDTGDYHSHKPWEANSVLPPLPHNAQSYSRRKDSAPSRTYGRQRSADTLDNSYLSQLSRHVSPRISVATNEDLLHRPKHSASLPSVVGGKGPSSRLKVGSYAPVSGGALSECSQIQSRADGQSNESTFTNTINSTEQEVKSKSIASNPDVDMSEKNSASINKLKKESDSEKKNRSQIPSLGPFRSSSFCRETSTSKSKNTGPEEDRASSRSTPDRSILSKFFQQDSEERSTGKDTNSTEIKEGTNDKKKTRRISRFLRPDFFDTPREESSFVKEKEAQKAAEEEKKKAKRIARRAALLGKKEKEPQKLLNDKEILKNNVSVEQSSLVKGNTHPDTELSLQNKASDQEYINDTKSLSKPSDSSSPSNKDECTPSGNNGKNRILHSLEKKWEKFRSSSDDSTAPSSKSRVEKAIRSLRERSVAPRGSDLITTESNLLKRAVSVDDMCSKTKVQVVKGINSNSSKLGSKVSSVLGLFRKMEDSQPDVQKLPQAVNRPSLLLSRLRRTQSVYAGSHSDSALLAHSQEILDSSISPKVISETQQIDSNYSATNEQLASVQNDTATFDVVVNAKTLRAADLPVEEVPVSTCIASTKPSIKNKETNQESNVTLVHASSETSDGKMSNKMQDNDKEIPEKSQQKETQSVGKQKPLTSGSLENPKIATGKVAVVRKSNKKNVGNSSSKVASSSSDAPKVKPLHTVDAGKDTVKAVKETKSDERKISIGNEQVQNAQSSEGQQEAKKTSPSSLSSVGSQGTSSNSEMKVKPPKKSDSVSVETTEQNAGNTTKLGCEIATVNNVDSTEAALVEKNIWNQDNMEKCPDSVKPEPDLAVGTDNTKSHVSHSMNQDMTCPKENVSKNKKCMVVSGCESLDKIQCQEPKMSGEGKLPVVIKLEAEDVTVPVSPAEECESMDSWSVCSDFEGRDFSLSPLPYPNIEGEATESVEDRIRRKSFYSRFNDMKKKSLRKLSPSYVGSTNYNSSSPQLYKNQGSLASHNAQELGYHMTPYNRKLSLPTKSHIALKNSNSADSLAQSYELHNGFGVGMTDHTKPSSEGSKNINDQNMEEKNLSQDLSSSINKDRSVTPSEAHKASKTSSSSLPRPIDFTQDVLRRSSLTKSRLPTASWERRASTPVGSRLPTFNNKSAQTGGQADIAASERENLSLDGKYDRVNSESSPSS